MSDYQAKLATARRAAEAAGKVLRDAAKSGPEEVTLKADQTPVTEIDLAAERAILDIIRSDWPDHAIWSEEQGAPDSDSQWLWLVDPLDGTRSFIRGTPFYSTQIALMYRGRVVVGVSLAPAFDECAWAARGQGAWLNDRRLSVSDVGGLRDATLSSGNIQSLAQSPTAWRAYGELVTAVERIRGYGDFCHYHLLARGALDVVVESDLNILDVAALSVIIEEAGGRVTQLDGRRLDLDTQDLLATNQRLHQPVLRRLQWNRNES